MNRTLLTSLVLVGAASVTGAQGPAFDSPGQSRYSTLGQTTQFSREFNPAFGLSIDTFFDYEDVGSDEDGFDIEVRLLELNASAFVDPEAWAYAVFVAHELEEIEVEEAAVHYIGFEGNSTLRVGRFFVDFGKQMQQHVEELRTLERPLPLREFLGEELGGSGIQYDTWFAATEETPVRFSVGVFGELLPGTFEEEDEDSSDPFTQAALAADNKDISELAFTARLTGMTDVGDYGLFQAGVSTRYLPGYDFDLEFDDGMVAFASTVEDLSEIVYGADLTFATTDDTGTRNLLLGGEVLVADGDISAEADPGTMTFAVNDDTAVGWFVFGDYGWDAWNSAGLQVSNAELRTAPDDELTEIEGYYTRHFTEYRRIRLGAVFGDGEIDDDWRFYVQFTSFFGNHAHGLNW
jgi:hypothetical protein